MPMNVFYIECDDEDMVPNKLYVRCHIDKEVVRIGEITKHPFKHLCEHPLYPALVRYIHDHPIKVKST